MSDDLVIVAMTESHQLLSEPAARLTGSLEGCLYARRSWHPVKAGKRNCREEARARGLVYLSLMRYLVCTRALLVTVLSEIIAEQNFQIRASIFRG